MTTGHRPLSPPERRPPVFAAADNLAELEAAVLDLEAVVHAILITGNLTDGQRILANRLAGDLNHTIIALRKEPA